MQTKKKKKSAAKKPNPFAKAAMAGASVPPMKAPPKGKGAKLGMAMKPKKRKKKVA